jgi:hypothetical protein
MCCEPSFFIANLLWALNLYSGVLSSSSVYVWLGVCNITVFFLLAMYGFYFKNFSIW